MKDEILGYTEVEKSSRAKSPKLRYRKGLFTVVVPKGLELDVEEVVENNFEWFESYLAEARSYREKVPDRSFEEGEVFNILGDGKKIKIEKRRSNNVEKNIFLAEHLVSRTSVKDQLEKALRTYARKVFEENASKFSKEVDRDFEKIFIRDQKTRWGSCSTKNNLNFNWRLILGPEKVLEYVVVHELVHLEIKNHGEAFQKRVEEIFPEASEAREWLDDFSAELVFDPEL